MIPSPEPMKKAAFFVVPFGPGFHMNLWDGNSSQTCYVLHSFHAKPPEAYFR